MKNPNELSAASSLRGDELQLIEQKASIVVGIANSRTRLRIGILLSKYSEYQVDYISSESEIGKLIEEADLIIGAGITAYEGVLRRKPVIVVGDYGGLEDAMRQERSLYADVLGNIDKTFGEFRLNANFGASIYHTFNFFLAQAR